MKENKSNIIAALLRICLIIASFIYAYSQRFYVKEVGKHDTFIVDKWTAIWGYVN